MTKTTITIDNGKITVEVDDHRPVTVETSPLAPSKQIPTHEEDRTSSIDDVPIRIMPPSTYQPDKIIDVKPLEPKPVQLPGGGDTKKSPVDVKKSATRAARVFKPRECVKCGKRYTPTGPTGRTCSECRFAAVNTQPEPKPSATKKCTKCSEDMPATSMYDRCANCRPAKTKACKFCASLAFRGKGPCKKHRNGPVTVTKPADEVSWCVHCKAYRAHRSEECPDYTAPQFLNGHEKSTEEIESWRPKPSFPTEMPKGAFVSGSKSDNDPWNCQRCRDVGGRCELHASMEDDGKKPPRF